MRAIIIRTKKLYDHLIVRVILGDLGIRYYIGVDPLRDEDYIVASTNIFKYYILIKRLRKEIREGAQFDIIELA